MIVCVARRGKISIDVEADVDRFADELERDLNGKLRGVKVDGDRIGDQLADGVRRGSDRAEGHWRDANGRMRDEFGRFVKEVESDSDRAGNALSRMFTRLKPDADQVRQRLRQISTLLLKIAEGAGKLTAVVAALGALGAVSGAATYHVLGLAAALGQTAGIAALLPAIAVVGAAAFGALRLATAGFGEAIKQALTGDLDEFNEAIENLSPNAQSLARELRSVAPQLIEIKDAAQDAFAGQLLGSVKQLTAALAGPLKTGMASIAAEYGRIAAGVAVWAAQPETVDQLSAAMSTASSVTASLGGALVPILDGFLNLATVALPVVQGLADSLGAAGVRFGEWLTKIAESGQALKWIDQAIVVLGQLGSLTGAVGSVLVTVLSAASESGVTLVSTLASVVGQFNTFLQSAQGQQALTSLFETLASLASGLGPVFRSLFSAIGSLMPAIGVLGVQVTKGLQAIAPALGPVADAIGAVLQSVGAALPSVGATIGTLASALASGVQALAPALGPVVRALAQVLEAAAPLLPVVGQLAEVLATNLAVGLSLLAQVLTPVVAAVAGALAPVIPQLADAFAQWMAVVSPLAETFGGLLTAVVTQLLPPILELLPALITGILPAMTDLIPIIQQNAGSITQLLTALTPLLPSLLQLAVALAPLIIMMLQLSASIFGALIPALIPLIAVIVLVATKFLSVLVPAISWVVSTIVGPLVGAISTVISWFGRALGAVIGFVAGIGPWLSSVPGKVRDAFAGVPGAVKDAFASAASWLTGAGANIIQGLINGIKSKIGDLKGALSDAASTARSYFPFSPAKVGPLSGSGDPTIAGRKIVQMLAAGISSTVPELAATTARAASVANVGVRAGDLVSGPGLSAAAESAATSTAQPAGRTYNISVNSLDPRSAGELVIGAIVDFEKNNGARWRT